MDENTKSIVVATRTSLPTSGENTNDIRTPHIHNKKKTANALQQISDLSSQQYLDHNCNLESPQPMANVYSSKVSSQFGAEQNDTFTNP